ncbi:MAG TPA: hypothetical protein VK610_05050 [Rhodothermales bacterium]|nr:hypothetical protein [Rhodothermales bacterium]
MGQTWTTLKHTAYNLRLGLGGIGSPALDFHADGYLQNNARRLEHLATLSLPLAGKTVLELGAGIGDHSHFYLDRGCLVTITEPRARNLRYLRRRYPGADVRALDVEHPAPLAGGPFEVTHSYGLLYHLGRPAEALDFMAGHTAGLLLLETRVSFGAEDEPHVVEEHAANPTQAASGRGCRPTRVWVWNRLRSLFPHVYVPRTQPNHAEFPLDWTRPDLHAAPLQRAIFVASRQPLDLPALAPTLLDRQDRHP